MILSVPLIELLRIWAELTSAYYGRASHGDVAEIYAYRLMVRSPKAEKDIVEAKGNIAWHSLHRDKFISAAKALCELCELFRDEFECRITIDGYQLSEWRFLHTSENGVLFDHRAHVKVN